jgi:CheY-like chemotaxis protein
MSFLTPVPGHSDGWPRQLPSPLDNAGRERMLRTQAHSPQPLILVIEDHDDSRQIACLVLESAGFRVETACTGLEGLYAALQTRPAAILLDIVLPEIHGWDLARIFRDNYSTRDTVIIALTALAGPDDAARSFAAGCDEVITKPVHPRKLIEVVARYVGMPYSARVSAG